MPTKTLQGPCTHCGRPISYPAEMVGTSTTCPHCGQVTDLLLETPPSEPAISHRTLVWTSLTVLILVGGLTGTFIALKRARNLAANRSQSAEARRAAAGLQGADTIYVYRTNNFQVSRIVVSRAPGSPLPEGFGSVSNELEKVRAGVMLRVEFMDRSGRVLGAVTDSTPSIGPRQVWKFQVPVFDTNAVSGRAVSVTAQN